MARLTVDEFNSKLDSVNSNFMLDDSDKAIEDFYELCLTDDESTGEPDEDLPSFSKDQAISSIGESIMTLFIVHPLKAFKNQEEGVHTTIQSIVESMSNSTIVPEHSPTSDMYEEKGTRKESSRLSKKFLPNQDDKDENPVRYADQKCCKCVIF